MTRYTPQWLQAGSYPASLDRRLLGALWPTPAVTGMAVTVAGGMTLNIAAGQAAVPTQNNTGTTLCSSDAVEQVVVGAAPGAGTNRIDLVTVQPRANDLDGGANTDFVFSVVAGVAAAAPAVPATPAGQLALAQIYVGGGVAAIVAGNITDVRPGGLAIGGAGVKTPQGWMAFAQGPPGTTDATAGSTFATVTFNVVAGRKYRVTGSATGTVITSAGSPRAVMQVNSGPAAFDQAQEYIFFTAGGVTVPASTQPTAARTAFLTATGTGPVTVALIGSCAGTSTALRATVNSCFLNVEDAGST